MSIKQECFKLSKEIWKLDIREDIKQIICSMNYVSENSTKEQRDSNQFAYIAKQQHAQFMGYLIVDYKRDILQKSSKVFFEGLDEKTLEVIKKSHYILEYINKKCIEEIISKYPNLDMALSVYSQFDYPKYSYDINDLIDEKLLIPLISEIRNCKIAKNIMNASSEIKKVPENEFLSVVLELKRRIQKNGVTSIPKDFYEILLPGQPLSMEVYICKLFLQVLSLREIINNVLRILYQAFLIDKLIIFNEENIINVDNYTKTLLGAGLIILTQPSDQNIHTSVTDLVLCNISSYDILNKLFVVYGFTMSFSQENGTSKKYHLAMLDDDLNPYFSLK